MKDPKGVIFLTSIFVMVFMCNIAMINTAECPVGCSVCEKYPGTSYVMKAVCTGVPPIQLPSTVREITVEKVQFPGVIGPESFDKKTELTLLQITDSTGDAIILNKAFQVCSKLANIVIENSDLMNLGDNNFHGLTSLQTLSLKNNHIMHSAKAFAELKQLTFLDLQSNQLVEIDNHTFQGLTNLYILYLSDNKIETIASNAFRDLVALNSLTLSKNRLKIIEPGLFKGLTNLKKLKVKENEISQIGPGAFQGTELQELNFQKNKFKQFPLKVLNNLTNVPKKITFAHNDIAALGPNAFEGMDSLIMDLSHNQIATVDEDAFHDCSLKMVMLDFNNITRLEAKVQPFWNSIRALTIAENPWHCDCSLLWMVEFVAHSSPRKYKARGNFPDPKCAAATNYPNDAFKTALVELEKECITTTTFMTTTIPEKTSASMAKTTPIEITSTMMTTLPATSTPATTEDLTRKSKTLPDTTAPTTNMVPITTRASTTPVLTRTTTTTTPLPSKGTSTVITTKVGKIDPGLAPPPNNHLIPWLWIGLALLGGAVIAGAVWWFACGKKKRQIQKSVDPADMDISRKSQLFPVFDHQIINVQPPPLATGLPGKITPQQKTIKWTQGEDNTPLTDVHNNNNRTFQTISLA